MADKKFLVCVNKRFGVSSPSCFMRGSEKTLMGVRDELARRGLSYPVEEFLCFGQCTFGPAMRIAPGGEFFLGGTPDKVNEIVDWLVSEMAKEAES